MSLNRPTPDSNGMSQRLVTQCNSSSAHLDILQLVKVFIITLSSISGPFQAGCWFFGGQ